MSDLSTRELRILVAVERDRSFTAAAVALGMAQSAVSAAVRTCERKIGVVLFDRGRHGARPTPAGTRVVAHARRILRMLDVIPAEAQAADGGTLTGVVRIAAFRSAAAYLLPSVLDGLGKRHPDLTRQVRIVPEIGRGTAGEVADGRADLAIGTVPRSGVLPGMVTGPVLEEPYLLVYPPGHRTHRTLPLIDWPENCSSYTREWWSEQDWLPSATFTVEDDGVVLSMVAAGLGMAIVPALSLRGAPPGLVTTDLGPSAPTRQISYTTTPEASRTVAVRHLIRELRTQNRSLA